MSASELQAQAIETLIRSGFDAESVVDAVITNDMSRLEHTGECDVRIEPAE